jgi:hypothetical protein
MLQSASKFLSRMQSGSIKESIKKCRSMFLVKGFKLDIIKKRMCLSYLTLELKDSITVKKSTENSDLICQTTRSEIQFRATN